ncbi:SpoIIE family protein phosphatase [bacterium]|nr:SpoIIE family protein phosphatase [bacterium]
MKIDRHHILYIVFPLILFFVLIGIDFQFIDMRAIHFDRGQLRELVLLLAMILFVCGGLRRGWFRDHTLIQKLWFLGGFVIIFWICIQILKWQSPSDFIFPNQGIYQSIQPVIYILYTAILFLTVVLSVWIFVILKELIYIRQSKHTAVNFRLLTIFIFLYMFYQFLGGKEDTLFISNWQLWKDVPILSNIFLIFVILFIVVNGFRCKWMHYLNKNQKIGVFFTGGLILAFVNVLVIGSNESIASYSVTIAAFIECLLLLFAIYSGMALLGILLQLPSAGLMDKRIGEIRTLQELSNTIGSVLNIDELVSTTVELCRKVVGADFFWIELKEDSKYRIAGSQGIKKEAVKQIPDSVIQTIRKEIQQAKKTLLINDISKNKKLREIRKWHQKAGSLLAAPVQIKKKDLGILYAVKRDPFGFVEESRALFQAFADQVAVALDNANLVQVTIEQGVYREELRMAHEAQMRLLPRTMPEVKGIELDAFCVTANEIGGDFYDIIQVNNKRLDIVVGDVSGKGASAAFYMAELKGVIQALAPHFSSPKQILIEVNTFVCNHFESDTFATMVYGIFFPVSRQLHFVRAGHPPVGLIRKKKMSWLETRGLGLGLATRKMFNQKLEEKVLNLKKGDTIFIYTDGLSEARNQEEEEFGEERLTETLLHLSGYPTGEMLEKVNKQLEQFTQNVPRHDDITLVALRIV